ncbi:MAG TPA: aldo/keto reductase, partial [Candidatus Babeliales bacterium]|nr:aldo/keto reductase [Candidatus Babeliales bacterium]
IPPAMEQPEYNIFNRRKVEVEFAPLYKRYVMGTTIWSPLESGILTGKYNDGIPEDSRFARHPELSGRLTSEKIEKVKALQKIANQLGCKISQLALAWCLKNPNVSSVITGATHADQIKENMRAVELKNYLTDDVMKEIASII